MLKLFEVTGFKNFKDKISLDFSDVRDYQFNTCCISNGLIGKMIVYGKNSVGKTNLGLALFDIVSHLTTKNTIPSLYDYYLNSNYREGSALFHYVFSFGNDLVDYLYQKNDAQALIYEKVSLNNQLLYEYDYSLDAGDTSGIQALAPTLNWEFKDTDCILKYVINNTALENNHPLRQMMRFVSSMLWFRSLDENRYIGYKNQSSDYYDFIFDPDIAKEFEDLLHTAGVNETLKIYTDPDGKKRLYFDAFHPLPFFQAASNGTKALYTFFYWYKTAKDV